LVVDSALALRRYDRTRDLDRLIDLMGLDPHQARIAGARLTVNLSTVALRLSCEGPLLQTEAFAVLDVRGQRPRIILWRDLPSSPTPGPAPGSGRYRGESGSGYLGGLARTNSLQVSKAGGI